MKREKAGSKGTRGCENLYNLRVTSWMYTRTIAVLECGHLLLEVPLLNYYFQQYLRHLYLLGLGLAPKLVFKLCS